MRSSKVDKILASRISIARCQAGMSIEEAAGALGISTEDYEDIEFARVRIPAETISNLSLQFNKPTAWFFGQTPKNIDLATMKTRKN